MKKTKSDPEKPQTVLYFKRRIGKEYKSGAGVRFDVFQLIMDSFTAPLWDKGANKELVDALKKGDTVEVDVRITKNGQGEAKA